MKLELKNGVFHKDGQPCMCVNTQPNKVLTLNPVSNQPQVEMIVKYCLSKCLACELHEGHAVFHCLNSKQFQYTEVNEEPNKKPKLNLVK